MQISLEIKEKLLNTGYFLDNDYLAKYLALVANGSKKKSTEYSEKHHILQVSYFARLLEKNTKRQKQELRQKSNKLGTDEYQLITENNLVYLSFYNHCLAHYYLYWCTSGFLKRDNEEGILKMTSRNLQLRTCTETEIHEILTAIEKLRADPQSESFKYTIIRQVIQEYYSQGGYRLCQTKLAEQYNMQCTEETIKTQAQKLGIRGARYTPNWTEQEDEIMREYYAVYGYRKCQEMLFGRSKNAIQARAQFLGILAPGASKANAAWTILEDNLIRKYYIIGGTRLCKQYLPNRTEKAIKYRANNVLFIYFDPDQSVLAPCSTTGKKRTVYLISEKNEIIQEFASVVEAGKAIGLSPASVSNVCKGKQTSAKGYRFCFKVNYDKEINN